MMLEDIEEGYINENKYPMPEDKTCATCENTGYTSPLCK